MATAAFTSNAIDTDPRLLNSIRIARPGQSDLHLGPLTGSPTAEANVLITGVAKSAAAFMALAHEVETSMLSPEHRGLKMRQESAPALAALQTAADAALAHRTRVSIDMLTATVVERWSDAGVPFHVAEITFRLIDRMNAMTPGDRASLVAQMIHEPASQRATAQAVLHVPAELSGLTHTQLEQVRVGLLMAEDPQRFENLSLQAQQINQAVRSVGTFADLISQRTGSIAGLQTLAPSALLLKSQSALGWPDLDALT